MFPLVPSLVLAFFSFISSAFVIFRIVIPILPPHPLSRRVAPSEFGLPNFNFRSLSAADKSHLWLACLDILALAVFIWQAVTENTGGPSNFDEARDAASAARLFFALTLRQTCLLVISVLTLLHVRMGRAISFGAKHWILWTPTALLVVTSTTLAGVLAGAGVSSLFVGLVSYSLTLALFSSIAFAFLIFTLVIIKRNLAALGEPMDQWPPVKPVEEKPRPSFATEDIDALREGSSWITSDASSRHDSISAWSFSTHQTHMQRSGSLRIHAHGTASQPSLPPRSSFWFNPPTPANASVPPVPPLPSPYKSVPAASPSCALNNDPDPFRRNVSSNYEQRVRFGSQSSWLTSPSVSQTALSSWSYPTTQPAASMPDLNAQLLPISMENRIQTPALASAQVLGGYGYNVDPEKSLTSLAVSDGEIKIYLYRHIGWLVAIWVPLALSLPYLFAVSPNGFAPPTVFPILLMISVTISSPMLALNILLRSPIPIPSGLFDGHHAPHSSVLRAHSPAATVTTYTREYKRSGSVTVVEGRRSGDVWISNGDAVNGKSKLGRAVGLLAPSPRLAVLPLDEEPEDGDITPPLPMQMPDENSFPYLTPPTPQQSETSVEIGRLRTDSKMSSRSSGGEESLAYASRIMVAERHYSALATTLVVPASPEKRMSTGGIVAATTTGVAVDGVPKPSSHLRSRSVSSIMAAPLAIGKAITMSENNVSPSPPPSFPLPPTPPSVRNAKLLAHKKSHSSHIARKKSQSSSVDSRYSFGAVVNDDVNEIDALTAKVLPLLVPGLRVGDDMRIREDWDLRLRDHHFSPPVSSTVSKKQSRGPQKGFNSPEFGTLVDFSSPEMHSTPAQRTNKKFIHKRHHFSLPSLGLGRDNLQSWKAELHRALERKVGQYQSSTLPNSEASRRMTVWGGETATGSSSGSGSAAETEALLAPPSVTPLSRMASTRSLGLRVEVPHGIDSARTSVVTLLNDNKTVPTSSSSTMTLFELEHGLGPVAESTPHENQKAPERHTGTARVSNKHPQRSIGQSARRSSITYIKSDENHDVNNDHDELAPRTTESLTFAQWSSRAVRPLIPKITNRLERQKSSLSSPELKSRSPGGGLRPLSLLQVRDTNIDVAPAGEVASAGNVSGGTRPLTLGKKKQKLQTIVDVKDENSNYSGPYSANKTLKPLQLGRNDPRKSRNVLRQDSTVSNVLVSPSEQQIGLAYTHP